jgi:hypothetical protein
MKSVIKYLLIFVIGGAFFSACDVESNWDTMTGDFDPNNSTMYVQFLTSEGYWETSIDEAGGPEDIVITVGVTVLGAEPKSDITVTLSKNAESTIADAAWSLASNTITIPAGEMSASTTLTVVASEMTEDETVNLVIDMDAGGMEATAANQIDYDLKRIKFCPLEDLNDLVGTWKGTDNVGYASQVVTSLDGDNFMIVGMNVGWMEGWWEEEITEIVPVVCTMNPNGTLVIEKQYYMTTLYSGAPYRYEVSGSGKWDNCLKQLIFEYEIWYEGDSESLCDTYGSAYPTCFEENVTL